MENAGPADVLDIERIAERDVVAMLAMLDYLVAEVSKIDLMSAQCLMLARKSLSEAVAESLVRAH